MLNDRIQIATCCIASLLLLAVLSSYVQPANAQQNQTVVQNSTQIEGIKDELLLVHPVLSELMQEESTGVVEYLNELETQEAVHTSLALKSLQSLIELQSSHMMAESVGNQTALGNQTAMGNQTAAAANQTGP